MLTVKSRLIVQNPLYLLQKDAKISAQVWSSCVFLRLSKRVSRNLLQKYEQGGLAKMEQQKEQQQKEPCL